MKPYLFFLFFILTISGIKAYSQNEEVEMKTFEIEGRHRKYILFLPENLSKPAPLVFVLHGYGGSAKGMMNFSGMNHVAETNGFAVCYPQAVFGEDHKNSWNAGYSNPDVDDVKFLSSLATYLQKEYDLSKENTFCTGMSNGGDMSYQLGCMRPDIFKAIAPVAGCLMYWIYEKCNDTTGVPVFEIHGTDDDITLWDGDANYPAIGPGGYLGVIETNNFWVRKNQCILVEIDTLTDINPLDSSFIISEKHMSGINGNQVWLYSLIGGKHDWPGSWGNMDIKASEEIWKFFTLFIKDNTD